jgi:hypothetical protein
MHGRLIFGKREIVMEAMIHEIWRVDFCGRRKLLLIEDVVEHSRRHCLVGRRVVLDLCVGRRLERADKEQGRGKEKAAHRSNETRD